MLEYFDIKIEFQDEFNIPLIITKNFRCKCSYVTPKKVDVWKTFQLC